jgi:hypothetical protein
VVEITLGKRQSPMHFYDVSLVDGFNTYAGVHEAGGRRARVRRGVVRGGPERCCPSALEVKDRERRVAGCRSVCEGHGRGGVKYCCTGEYGTPAACKPTIFSHLGYLPQGVQLRLYFCLMTLLLFDMLLKYVTLFFNIHILRCP